MRSNPLYYIAPSAIALTPNCNGSANDIAVYISSGTKIKVYCPAINALGYVDNQFQEWTLTGRNRRLNGGDGPYAIYARITRPDATAGSNSYRAYLIFTPYVQYGGEWLEGHSHLTEDGLSEAYYMGGKGIEIDPNYWYVKLGEVSAVENGERTITLDTGILGTDAWNTQWEVIDADAPIRMLTAITLGDSTTDVLSSPVPYGKTVTVAAWLVQGWETPVAADHWTITRDTGDATADAAWQGNGNESDGRFYINIAFTPDRNDLGDLGKETFFTIRAYDAANNLLAEHTINIPHQDSQEYTVDMDMQSFAIMVDDFGNVEGGLWIEEEGGYKTYRLHTAITVRRGNKYLTIAPNGQEPGVGQYQIYPQAGDCTLMVSNGTVYVTAIDNIKDGVAGSDDDVMPNLWYDRMRRMKEATAMFTVVCEGMASITKSLPISIGHIDTAIVDVHLTPGTSSVQFNAAGGAYYGLPVESELVAQVEGSSIQPDVTDVALDIDGESVRWTGGSGSWLSGIHKRYRRSPGWDIIFEPIEDETSPVSSDSSSDSNSSDSDSSYSSSSDSSSSDSSSDSSDSSDIEPTPSPTAPLRYHLVVSRIPDSYTGQALVVGLTVTVRLAGLIYEYRRTLTVGIVGSGGNTVTVFLYQRSDVPITTTGIQQRLFYKFSTRKLYTDSACSIPVENIKGWSQNILDGTGDIYITAASAFSTGDVDDIYATEWATPALMSQSGSPGEHGVNTATINIYKRSSTTPDQSDHPSDLYYCFTDGKFYGTPSTDNSEVTDLNGWLRTVPDGTAPCYVRQAVALGTEDFDRIGGSEWSSASKLVEDGDDGVTYRCRWRLSGREVGALAALASGAVKDIDPMYATLNVALMKRVGGEQEEIYRGAGTLEVTIGTSTTTCEFSGVQQMNYNVSLSRSSDARVQIDSSGVTRITATFTSDDFGTLIFPLSKIFDGSEPVITIGTDGKWYINGTSTGVQAEGKDGTGVEIRGTVDVLYSTQAQGGQTSLQGLTGVSVGDCYVVDATRHIYFYDGVSSQTGVPSGWRDLGEFRGENGTSSYMHIAYAKNITFDTNGTPTGCTDFQTNYPGPDSGFDWIGFCTDNNQDDPVVYTAYKWNYTKGMDGNGYEYVYLRSKVEAPPTIDDTQEDGEHRNVSQDEYLPKVGNYSEYEYESEYFTDDPHGVSEEWPYEYQAVRKKNDGAWGDFSVALHRTYSKDGVSPYIASLNTGFATVRTTGAYAPIQQHVIYVGVSLRRGEDNLQPSVLSVKRNNTTMAWSSVNQRWSNGNVTVEYDPGTCNIIITYPITATVRNGNDTFTFSIAHVDGGTTLFEEEKVFSVSAIGNDVYRIIPSENQIVVRRTADGYDPATYALTCGYTKIDAAGNVTCVLDVEERIDNLYNIYFRRHMRASGIWESRYWLYTYYAQDRETIPSGSSSSDSESSDSSSSDSESSDSSSSDGSPSGELVRGMLTGVDASIYDGIEFIICRNTGLTILPRGIVGQIGSASVPVLTSGESIIMRGGVDMLYEGTEGATSLQGLRGMNYGDCYSVAETRHLYLYDGTSNEPGVPAGWRDMGEFRGENGTSSYMHIAYAENITFEEYDHVTPKTADGFTTEYPGSDYGWMGLLTDENEEPPTGDNAFKAYKWNYVKGMDGSGYEYVYMRSKVNTAPIIDETQEDNERRSRLQDEYLPRVAGYSPIGNYASEIFTDDPQGVSKDWPYEYQAVRKKANGTWGAFSSATLHRTYSDSPYAAGISTVLAEVRTTGAWKPTQNQTISLKVSLLRGTEILEPNVSAISRNGTPMTRLNGVWGDSGLSIIYDSNEHNLILTYRTNATIANGIDTFDITIADVYGNFSDIKTLTVSAKSRDNYTLRPNPRQITVMRVGSSFSQSTQVVECECVKTDIDGTTTRSSNGEIDSLQLYYRTRNRSSGWTNFTKYSNEYGLEFSITDNDAIEFVLCSNTSANITASEIASQVADASVFVVEDGAVGATGPSYYYLGEWRDTTNNEYIPNGTAIKTTDYERPFVSYTDEHGDVTYYIYIGTGEIEATSLRSNPAVDSDHWEQMASQNKFIISNAIFAQFAKFGGAIFNGDWMYSQYGVYYYRNSATLINGADRRDQGGTPYYRYFKPEDPLGINKSDGVFAPSLAIDLLTGRMIAAGGNFVVNENGNIELTASSLNLTTSNNSSLVFETYIPPVNNEYHEWFGFAARTTIYGANSGDILTLGVRQNENGTGYARLVLNQVMSANGYDNMTILDYRGLRFYNEPAANIDLDDISKADVAIGFKEGKTYLRLSDLPTKNDPNLSEGDIYVDDGFIKVKL